jgi:hypothetical protein
VVEPLPSKSKALTSNPSTTRVRGEERIVDSREVFKIIQRAGRVAQIVGHLPSKCEGLSSNSTTAKKINNTEKLDVVHT